MADVLAAPRDVPAQGAPAPPDVERNKPTMSAVTILSAAGASRGGHMSLDVFSPVNENGSFEFDRVLKHGDVHIRSKRTKVRPTRTSCEGSVRD